MFANVHSSLNIAHFNLVLFSPLISYHLSLKWTVMVLIKLKTLQSHLESVDSFTDPKLHLEQYITSPHIAAHMLHEIEMKYGDIDGHLVADLGCGTGMLSIGAAILGASVCIGVDIDSDALDICRENISEGEINSIDLLQMDVAAQLTLGDNHPWCNKFDTVIMNPPFGTKQIQGADMNFLKFGLLISNSTVYSLHKTTHVQQVVRMAKKLGVEVTMMSHIVYDLPRTYSSHKANSVDIQVELLRFSRIPSPEKLFRSITETATTDCLLPPPGHKTKSKKESSHKTGQTKKKTIS